MAYMDNLASVPGRVERARVSLKYCTDGLRAQGVELIASTVSLAAPGRGGASVAV